MNITNAKLLAITGLMIGIEIGQWELLAQRTPPYLYVKGAAETWQTRDQSGAGFEYTLGLVRWSGGDERKYWISNWQFRDTYGTPGSTVLFNSFGWNGAAYLYQQYQGDSWHCCREDLTWPSWEKLRAGQQGYSYYRSKDVWLEIATGGSERDSKFLLVNASGYAFTS